MTNIVWKFYIETRDTPLEEIAKYFYGDGAIIREVAATDKSKVLAAEMSGLVTVNMIENLPICTQETRPLSEALPLGLRQAQHAFDVLQWIEIVP